MTAQTTEATAARPAPVNYPPAAEIDYSCRWPVFLLLTKSVGWLVISLLLGVFAAVKMHAPGMFAEAGFLTYGRLAGAASTAFYYGFASQAAIAIGLWLFARLGHTFLVLPRATLVAYGVWNVGVLLAIFGILAGGLNHFPTFEMPGWVAPVLFTAYMIFGLSGILTFASRASKDTYPSSWFLFAAFFVFPWILASAWLLLGHYPVRGPLQPIVAGWYANNFLGMWLAPVALAVVFYLVPKLSNQPLYSYSIAAFGFWTYVMLAHATGFQNMPGVPNWLQQLSVVVNVLLVLPLLAFLVNWYNTWSGHNKGRKQKDPSTRYLTFSVMALIASAVLVLLLSCPVIDAAVGLTTFVTGTGTVTVWGFIAMAFFAAIMHIVPRVTETEWPSARLNSLHFGLTVGGLVLCAVAWLLGGVVQGSAWNNPAVSALDASRRIVPFIGINTLGTLLLLAGQCALLINMLRMANNICMLCRCFGGGKEVAR